MKTKRIALGGMAIIALFLMALPGTVIAADFTVSTAAELQDALAAADHNLQEDTIHIAAGTYYTSANGNQPFVYNPTSLDETYPLTIVGAGAGSTIIDGGWSGGTATDGTPGMIIDLTTFRGDNSESGFDDSAAIITIEGITVQNANNMDYTSSNEYDIYGGLAVETNKADVAISNCKFTRNNNAERYGAGGGLLVFTWGGDITLSNSTISDNHGLTETNQRQIDNGAGAALHTGRGNPTGYLNDCCTNGTTEEDEGSVTVTGCTFSGNGGDYVSWYGYGAPQADGGGLSARAAGGSISITESTFKNNIAGGRSADGGGVSAQTFYGNITFTGNTVTGNTASENGGGAALYSKFGQVTASDNLFKDNQLQTPPDESTNRVTDGAGLHLIALNGSTVTNNRFINNSLDGNYGSDGGGAHIGTYGDINNPSSNEDDPEATAGAIIKWNTFKGNTVSEESGDRADGGGLHARVASGHTLEAAYNAFISNTAETCGGGALFNNPYGIILLQSNYFYDNTAQDGYDQFGVRGGGAFVDTTIGSAYVINNTFDSNTTTDSNGGGLGVKVERDSAAAHLYNNIFWNNVAGGGNGDDLYIYDIDPHNSGDTTGAPVVLDTNNFQAAATDPANVYVLSRDGGGGETPDITETGTTTDDPLFLAAGNPQLDPSSPMIDAGKASAPNLPLFDIFGSERAYAAPVDVGAYEEVGLAIASTDATVSLTPSPPTPSDLDDVSQVVGFIATDVTDSADISITFPSLPAKYTIYKVLDSGNVQIYPENKAENKGITNVSLSKNVLRFTVEDNSEADIDDTVGTIEDPVAVVEKKAAASGGGGSSGDCFIDTITNRL